MTKFLAGYNSLSYLRSSISANSILVRQQFSSMFYGKYPDFYGTH